MQVEHVDVIIVGAGLSGIGAACHLSAQCPDKSYVVLESREASGGTWDLFRYPGVRSDSDMFTLGYAFQPWEDVRGIANGQEILDYIRGTAASHGVEEKIRYSHQVATASWSSHDARWTVEARRGDSAESVRITCGFLHLCTGYYRYDQGYAPVFQGTEQFTGQIVHPQFWPEDLDYEGKQVVVIGSGATAVTLVPALARKAASTIMLQRSPSYVLSRPRVEPFAVRLSRLLSAKAAYPLVRWKNILQSAFVYRRSRRRPDEVKAYLRSQVRRRLPRDFDVDTHFRPRYDPWDERLCMVPDGDLFAAIRDGKADVVTDTIDTFTEKGIALTSGSFIEADIVVTATGLSLLSLGGISLEVDGVGVDPAQTVSYKGMMLSGVPNFAMTIGYTNASWTLKADLVADYVCRLLRYMNAKGYRQATPVEPPADQPTEPVIDLKSGYVQRSVHELPKQGTVAPWRLHQNYPRDLFLLRHGRLNDKGIVFTRAPGTRPRTASSGEE